MCCILGRDGGACAQGRFRVRMGGCGFVLLSGECLIRLGGKGLVRLSGVGLFRLDDGGLVQLGGKGGTRYGGIFRRWGRACQLPVGGENWSGCFVIVADGFFPVPTPHEGGGGHT